MALSGPAGLGGIGAWTASARSPAPAAGLPAFRAAAEALGQPLQVVFHQGAPSVVRSGAARLGALPGLGELPLLALVPQKATSRVRGAVVLAALFGAALLYGDGVITPAISVLSAVEGLGVATHALEKFVVPITLVVLLGLFLVQRKGTDSIGKAFGPLMLVWFIAIAALGVKEILLTPSVLLAISLSGAMGAGAENTLLALTLVFIPPICRVSESVTTQVRGFDFVDAARASGARTLTIVRVHVLGNVLGPILVYATSLISVAIILAAGLSFLGLGVKPPEPEWGLMLNTLRQAIYVNPVLAALPGVMIFITSICFNLMSDGLRAAMDVKA